jgi:hypothetical protein
VYNIIVLCDGLIQTVYLFVKENCKRDSHHYW